MKILADESLDGPIVAWLRSIGHDVFWAAEQSPGESDESLVRQAEREGQVIITSDRDFGELIFRNGARPAGVLLLRMRGMSPTALVGAFQAHWPSIEVTLVDYSVVLGGGRLRIRPLQARS